MSLKISGIQDITLKHNYAKIVVIYEVSPIIFELLRSMLACCSVVETTGHYVLWFPSVFKSNC